MTAAEGPRCGVAPWLLPREREPDPFDDCDEETRPYVCPGCHAVVERCAPWCIDKEIEDREGGDMCDDGIDDEDCEDECEGW